MDNRPGPSRQWSEEAVKGSWQSTRYQSFSSPTPRNQNPAWMRIDTLSDSSVHHSKQAMVNQWLGQQNTQDPSATIDAVQSELTTPTTSTISPAISDAATFPSRISDIHPAYALQNASLTPPSKSSRWQQHLRESSTSSSQDRSYRYSEHRSTDNHSANHTRIDSELAGVGSFADADNSRYDS